MKNSSLLDYFTETVEPTEQRIFVGKGLDKKEAIAKAVKKAKGDFRGTNYDEETGYVTLI